MRSRVDANDPFSPQRTHAYPPYLEDVNARDPITHDAIEGSAYGWDNCIEKEAGQGLLNADNYLMLMTAARRARQKRFIIQHSRILGGYNPTHFDDVSTDEATRLAEIDDGKLRFYIGISTPGNPRARML